MTEPVALAISIIPPTITLFAGFIVVGRLRERMEGQTNTLHDLKEQVDRMSREAGGGDVTRADMLARLLQVERNTAAVGNLGDRVTRLETAYEMNSKSVMDKLDKLGRDVEGINRMASSAMRSATRGGFSVLPPDTPD